MDFLRMNQKSIVRDYLTELFTWNNVTKKILCC